MQPARWPMKASEAGLRQVRSQLNFFLPFVHFSVRFVLSLFFPSPSF